MDFQPLYALVALLGCVALVIGIVQLRQRRRSTRRAAAAAVQRAKNDRAWAARNDTPA